MYGAALTLRLQQIQLSFILLSSEKQLSIFLVKKSLQQQFFPTGCSSRRPLR